MNIQLTAGTNQIKLYNKTVNLNLSTYDYVKQIKAFDGGGCNINLSMTCAFSALSSFTNCTLTNTSLPYYLTSNSYSCQTIDIDIPNATAVPNCRYMTKLSTLKLGKCDSVTAQISSFLSMSNTSLTTFSANFANYKASLKDAFCQTSLTSLTMLNAYPTSLYNTFSNSKSLKKVDFGYGNNVTTAYNAFAYCSGLTSYSVKGNFNNLTNAESMFYNCRSLSACSLGSLNAVQYGSSMFMNCYALTSFTSSFSSATSMDSMFYGCSSLTYLNLGVLGNLTLQSSMLQGCTKLTGFTANCSAIARLNATFTPTAVSLQKVNLGVLTNCTSWYRPFYGCSALTSVTMNADAVLDSSEAFEGCKSLTSLACSMVSVTASNYMYSGCSSIKDIQMNNLSALTCANMMFAECSALSAIHLGSVVALTNAYRMFYNCKSLTGTYIPTTVLQDATDMYYNCTSLTTAYWNNSGVVSANSMFYNCSAVNFSTTVKLTSATGLNSTFYNCITMTAPVYGCDSWDKFSGATVLNMSNTFYNCQNIPTIVGFNVSSVDYISTGTFYNCKALTALCIKGWDFDIDTHWSPLGAWYVMEMIINAGTKKAKTFTISKTAYNNVTADTTAYNYYQRASAYNITMKVDSSVM